MNLVGQHLGDYRILEPIGSGGMGQVYLAEHVHLRKKYAVKVLPAELARDRNFVARFHDEARVMAELRHDRIVQVHNASHLQVDSGNGSQDVYFLVMDYVVGPEGKPLSLHEHLKTQPEGRLPQEQVRKWAIQIAEALAYAHEKGVVHRDIKPANILIDANNDVKLTDFGLAKAIGNEFINSQIHQTMLSLGSMRTLKAGATTSTEQSLGSAATLSPDGCHKTSSASSILGTYDYMTPEQRGEYGGKIDQRTDIYALGIVLYRILTGRRPTGMAKPPSQVVAGIPESWDDIITQCTADSPAERPENASALLTSLQCNVRGGSRRKAVLAGVVVLMLAALGIAAYRWTGAADQGSAPQPVSAITKNEAQVPRPDTPPAPIHDAAKEKLARFDDLLKKAKTCTTWGQREEGLQAVREGLLLIPDDPSAIAERDRLRKLENPEIAEERKKKEQFDGLLAKAKGCTTWEERQRGRDAIDDALELFPENDEAKKELGRLNEMEDPEVVAERKKKQKFDALLAEAKLSTHWEERDAGLRAVEAALKLYPDRADAKREKKRLEAIEDPEVLAEQNLKPEVYTVWPFDAAEAQRRRQETAQRMGASPTLTLDCGNGVQMELVLIPAGEFMMGSPVAKDERMTAEIPKHRVRIGSPLFMGKYEVTQEQWQSVMGENPSHFHGTPNLPVEQVSWLACKEFCKRLSSKTGRTVRLPSEAEWEYACRAGTTTEYSFGENLSSEQANCDYTYINGVFSGQRGMFREKTTAVGSFPANAWGLCDMHGNASEWCEDVNHMNYNGAPTDGRAWSSSGEQDGRVTRGGSWRMSPLNCRSSERGWDRPVAHANYSGFRVVVVSSETP